MKKMALLVVILCAVTIVPEISFRVLPFLYTDIETLQAENNYKRFDSIEHISYPIYKNRYFEVCTINFFQPDHGKRKNVLVNKFYKIYYGKDFSNHNLLELPGTERNVAWIYDGYFLEVFKIKAQSHQYYMAYVGIRPGPRTPRG